MKHEARKLSVSYAMTSKLLDRTRTYAGAKRMVEITLAEMLAMAILDEGVAEIKEETQGSESVMKMEVIVLVKKEDNEEGGDQ